MLGLVGLYKHMTPSNLDQLELEHLIHCQLISIILISTEEVVQSYSFHTWCAQSINPQTVLKSASFFPKPDVWLTMSLPTGFNEDSFTLSGKTLRITLILNCISSEIPGLTVNLRFLSSIIIGTLRTPESFYSSPLPTYPRFGWAFQCSVEES